MNWASAEGMYSKFLSVMDAAQDKHIPFKKTCRRVALSQNRLLQNSSDKSKRHGRLTRISGFLRKSEYSYYSYESGKRKMGRSETV